MLDFGINFGAKQEGFEDKSILKWPFTPLSFDGMLILIVSL
jgi:hypothetical protein